MRCLAKYIVILIAATIFAGCAGNDKVGIEEIRVSLHNNNELKIQIDVTTDQSSDVHVEYCVEKRNAGKKFYSTQSHSSQKHTLILCNIAPQTTYAYQIIATRNGVKTISKTYTFRSNALAMFLQEQFIADSSKSAKLSSGFADGLMLINKRYAPGVAYLVDKKGAIRWYHMVDGLGFKVAHFTNEHTILAIMGGNDEPTSYGHEILEVNLLGDTILHLKKGQNDFRQMIHHEITKKNKGQLVTLFVDKKTMDLSSIGGGKKDTVSGDGILVMDNVGKKIWSWSVFDALDPLQDKGLLKTIKDWMHANSLNFDKDGNYIISFYNNGQKWKVDAHTGK